MLKISQIDFVVEIVCIAQIECSFLFQIRDFKSLLHVLFIIENDIRRKNRIVVSYSLNISERFAIVRISDCKFSMTFSNDDILIVIHVYSEVCFVHIDDII